MENTSIDFSAYPNTLMLKRSISTLLEREKRLDPGELDRLSTVATNYLRAYPKKVQLVHDLLAKEGLRYALTQLEVKVK